jgi:hypothetical protein
MLKSEPTIKYGSDSWVLDKRDNQHLEAAQMKFLTPLLKFIKLDDHGDIDRREKLQFPNLLEDMRD